MNTKDYFEIGFWIVSVGILIATVYYIATAPIRAVRIGRDLNDEQNRDSAKRSLFLTLFAYRGSPLNYNFVEGLNKIEIVFHDTPTVLTAWRSYYKTLHQKDLTDPVRIWEIGRIELLSQMAIALGYGSLNQVDIMQTYYPEGLGDKHRFEVGLQVAALEFFRTGRDVYQAILDRTFAEDEAKKQGQEHHEQTEDN